MKPTSLNRLPEIFEAWELSIATAAGLSADQWHSLRERERITIRDLSEDSRLASGHGETLEQFRSRTRRRIESRERDGECVGLPQWLRDARAKDRPDEQAVFYLSLVTEASTANLERLGAISRIVHANTGSGYVSSDTLTRTEIRDLLLEEIERAGLSEWYQEAERQQAERANQ